jgi:hypothetical protein
MGSGFLEVAQRERDTADPAQRQDLRALLEQGKRKREGGTVALAGTLQPSAAFQLLSERDETESGVVFVSGVVGSEDRTQPLVQRRDVRAKAFLRFLHGPVDVLGGYDPLVDRGVRARAVPGLAGIRNGRADDLEPEQLELVDLGQQSEQLFYGCFNARHDTAGRFSPRKSRRSHRAGRWCRT